MNDHLKWANGSALPMIDSAQDAAKAYFELGLRIVPIPKGEKAPRLKDWPNLRIPKDDIGSRFGADSNIGVLLGEPSGHLVDVDLDCREAVALAPRLLPPTSAIFGRRSKRDSHWLYVLDQAPVKTIALADDKSGTLVELRSTGGQTVFPPSQHPSGESIFWSQSAGPAVVNVGVLERSVRALAAASLLARHWPSDGRHALSMPVGGALARAGYHAAEIDTIIRAVCGYANDSDVEDRVRTAKDAAERLAEDRTAYGLSRLGEIMGEAVAKALASILALPKEKERGETQRDRAIDSMDGIEFWTTPNGEAYATVFMQDHPENHRIKSRAFRRIVQVRAMESEGRHVPRAAIDEALASAEAQAAIGGIVHDVHLRVAAHHDAIYIDLGGPDWRAVRIDKESDQWSITNRPPVKFIRPPGVKPLPLPEAGGSLDELRPLINVSEESDFRLFVAAMLAALIPDKPYPVLIVTGEQGTSKTTLTRIFKYMVYGGSARG
jgi:hypothetical protein